MRSPLIIRRAVGGSMLPTISSNHLVIATGFYKRLSKDNVIIFEHNGIEKIKRIKDLRSNGLYVIGDNPSGSTDSRDFGWIPFSDVRAKVIWPAKLNTAKINN